MISLNVPNAAMMETRSAPNVSPSPTVAGSAR